MSSSETIKKNENATGVREERDYRFDNMRCLLIFMVILGHCMELFLTPRVGDVYRIIYAFHMPVFMIITGYFARFDRKRLLFDYIYVYVLFQVLYLWFDARFVNEVSFEKPQYMTPYWFLWYIFVTIVFTVCIPLFDTDDLKKQIGLFGFAVCISLYMGFDESIGYYLASARIFSYLPFFVLGFYLAKHKDYLERKLWVSLGSLIVVLIGSYLVYQQNGKPEHNITSLVLFGSFSYKGADYTMWIKLGLFVLAVAGFFLLVNIIPRKRILLISTLGKNTFPIYILHGFLVKILMKEEIFHGTSIENLLLAAGISFFIMILLGNPLSAYVFRTICTGRWIQTIYKSIWGREHS